MEMIIEYFETHFAWILLSIGFTVLSAVLYRKYKRVSNQFKAFKKDLKNLVIAHCLDVPTETKEKAKEELRLSERKWELSN